MRTPPVYPRHNEPVEVLDFDEEGILERASKYAEWKGDAAWLAGVDWARSRERIGTAWAWVALGVVGGAALSIIGMVAFS